MKLANEQTNKKNFHIFKHEQSFIRSITDPHRFPCIAGSQSALNSSELIGSKWKNHMLPLTDRHCKCVTRNKSYDQSSGRKTKWTFFCFFHRRFSLFKTGGGGEGEWMGAQRMFSKSDQDTTFPKKEEKKTNPTNTATHRLLYLSKNNIHMLKKRTGKKNFLVEET